MIADKLSSVTRFLGHVVAWLTLVMVVVTFAVVGLRYGWNWGSIAMQEFIMYCHANVFMLGAAYTLQQERHVRVDIFYTHLSLRGKAWIDLGGLLLLLLPMCGLILWSSSEYVWRAWQIREGSPETGGIPAVFLLKTLLPLLALTLILQGLAQGITLWKTVREISA